LANGETLLNGEAFLLLVATDERSSFNHSVDNLPVVAGQVMAVVGNTTANLAHPNRLRFLSHGVLRFSGNELVLEAGKSNRDVT